MQKGRWAVVFVSVYSVTRGGFLPAGQCAMVAFLAWRVSLQSAATGRAGGLMLPPERANLTGVGVPMLTVLFAVVIMS